MEQIKGGYYIKARAIQHSHVMNMPPCTREIWDYLLMMANHSDNEICKRGQHITTISKIREALSWRVGYRKEMYKKHSCENSMKALKKAGMITTTKTTRGTMVTICNYSFYQDSKNYESQPDNFTATKRKWESCRTINKNEKEEKNEKNDKNDKNNPNSHSPQSNKENPLPQDEHAYVAQLFNSIIAGASSNVKKVTHLTASRKDKINHITQSFTKDLLGWKTYFELAARQEFIKNTTGVRKGFITFDTFLKEETFVRVNEKMYESNLDALASSWELPDESL